LTVLTKTLAIDGFFGALDHLSIKKRLSRLSGVTDLDVNGASTSATITCDETVTNVDALMKVNQGFGFLCRGEALSAYICVPAKPASHSRHEHAAQE
jgi:hypothetical protein